MNTLSQINQYLESISDNNHAELISLHKLLLQWMPDSQLWFLDGKNESGKIVANPNIGYGLHTIRYTNGSSKEFYKIGISANSKGLSVYIMGIADKNYLVNTYSKTLGKARILGYCIQFRKLKDIQLEVLETLIKSAYKSTP